MFSIELLEGVFSSNGGLQRYQETEQPAQGSCWEPDTGCLLSVMNTTPTDLLLSLRVKCPKRDSKITKGHIGVFSPFFHARLSAPRKELRVKHSYPDPQQHREFSAGIWAGSSQVLVLSSSAALPLVLPSQHVPVSPEALTKSVEGLHQQFQSESDLIIAPHFPPTPCLDTRDLVLPGLAL